MLVAAAVCADTRSDLTFVADTGQCRGKQTIIAMFLGRVVAS